jgi:flagellar biosynthesis protein FlhF
MKLKTYRAVDMRSALHAVRTEQGSSAVIMSTNRTDEGVEVIAAIDYDSTGRYDLSELTATMKVLDLTKTTAVPAAAVAAATATAAPAQEPTLSGLERIDGSELGSELKHLRQALEQQAAVLAWNDYTRREPLKSVVLTKLSSIGIGREVAKSVVAELPSPLTPDRARSLPFALLASRIRAEIPERLAIGNAWMFAGPNGAGKTTLLAKIAVQWLLEHGPQSLTLISTDTTRLGAAEHFGALGRLLGVRAVAAVEPRTLGALVRHYSERSLVLIDTEGCGPRDTAAIARLSELRHAAPEARTCLVLSAASQAAALIESHKTHASGGIGGCALTHLDEAASLGGALTLLATTGMPLHWLSEGARIPDDLKPARALQLVLRAADLARDSGATADEETLARRYVANDGERVRA